MSWKALNDVPFKHKQITFDQNACFFFQKTPISTDQTISQENIIQNACQID